MRSVVQTSLALCSIVYITTSFFGFLLFGDSTLDDVLANLDSNLGIPYSLLNDTVRICYVVHLMFVFPTIFHPLRLNLDGLLFPSSVPLVINNCRFALITMGLLSVVFLGANFIPNIWDAFQFTGANCCCLYWIHFSCSHCSKVSDLFSLQSIVISHHFLFFAETSTIDKTVIGLC